MSRLGSKRPSAMRDKIWAADRSAAERYDADDLSLYDRERIRVERIRYEGRYAAAVVAAISSRQEFSSMIAPFDESVVFAPVGLPEGRPAPASEFDLLTAVARHPEVVAQEAGLQAARAEASAVRRSRLPDLVATGGYKTQSDGFDGTFLGLSISLPLWDRKGGAVQAAEAWTADREASLVQARRQVAARAEAAMEAYRLTQLIADLIAEPLEGQIDLLEIASTAYAEGEMELIELLDAAGALLEAEFSRIGVQAELWNDYFELDQAIGGIQ